MWDCSTGNGQAAVALAEFFACVYATDASATQIEHAQANDRVEYQVAPAERSGLDDASMNLVTVAQAIHWFDFDAFFDEVRRVLKPDGLLAVWTYGVPTIEGVPDDVLLHFHRQVVGPYWPPERRYVDEDYETIPFPFDELETPGFSTSLMLGFDDFLGFVRTWSAVKQYVEQRGEDPVPIIEAEMSRHWRDGERRFTWPVYLRIGRDR